MKVSIITIVYNNQECIQDCLMSVQNQTYHNIEHIVIDGGSNDGTQEKIKPFVNQLACYVSERDNGLYDGLNKGIKKATGDIIGILHSDDLFYDKDVIKNVVNSFKLQDVDLLYGSGFYVEKDKIENVKRIYPGKSFKKKNLYFGWIPLHTTIYVKKEIFETYRYYDESYSIASDYDISLRWFLNKKITKYFLNQYLVKMRLGGKSTTASLQKKKSIEDLKIIKKHNLLGSFTLFFKILRKVPQYLMPRVKKI